MGIEYSIISGHDNPMHQNIWRSIFCSIKILNQLLFQLSSQNVIRSGSLLHNSRVHRESVVGTDTVLYHSGNRLCESVTFKQDQISSGSFSVNQISVVVYTH